MNFRWSEERTMYTMMGKLKLNLNGHQIRELMESRPRPSIFNYAILADLQTVRALLSAVIKGVSEECIEIKIDCDELEDVIPAHLEET